MVAAVSSGQSQAYMVQFQKMAQAAPVSRPTATMGNNINVMA